MKDIMIDEKIFKSVPFKHQEKALQLGGESINYAYFMEMGTGKTKVAIDNANLLYSQNKINDVIVIAPNSVYTNWIQEIKDHSKNEPDIFVWKKSKLSYLKKYKYDNFFFLLINIESLSRGAGQNFLLEHLKKRGKHSLLIIDEATTIKNKEASRTKFLVKHSQLAKYRRILTGSPVTKSPLDLYTQCQFLNNDLLGFSSFYTFRNRYAIMKEINLGSYSTKIPIKYINLEELEQKLKTFSFRVTKEECLDLPYKLYSRRNITLSEEQKIAYKQLKDNARAIIMNEEVSFNNKLTEILKLHQVTCGFTKSVNEEIIKFKTNPKIDELMQVLSETDTKCIIWANYIVNIKDIISTLKETYGKESVVSLYGEVSVQNRELAVKKFQNDTGCRFIVGNPSVGGYGLTLTAARNVIYFSNSYNLEHRQQSEDRAHRIGQVASVTYIDFVVPDSIDELILTSLKTKKGLSHQVMGDKIKELFA
jgi:SNF2 family DNA or RNA helicase